MERASSLSRKNTAAIWLLAAILIIADQTIKLIIRDNFMQLHFDIVGGLLYFQPLHNIKLSWINSLLGANVGFLPHVITNVIILVLLVWGRRYAASIRSIPLPLEYSFIFILAGAICSVIDKIFWGGSLDFIGLFSWFIFDTKDLYITVGITIFAIYTLAYSLKNPKAANGSKIDGNMANGSTTDGSKADGSTRDGSTTDDMQLVKDFICFMGKDVVRLYGKIFGRHE